jgi:hypothetical protein
MASRIPDSHSLFRLIIEFSSSEVQAPEVWDDPVRMVRLARMGNKNYPTRKERFDSAFAER